MSARGGNDAPRLWLVRPIRDGAIDDREGHLFAGDREAMVAHIADLHRTTGRQHAAREAE